MRTRMVVVLSMLLAVALLAPTSAWARRVSASGSLSFNLAPPGTLTNQVVVTVVTLDQEDAVREEVEATVTLPLPGPIYTAPYVVNKETTASVPGDFDTVLFIVNVTSIQAFPVITVRRADGSTLTTVQILGGLAPGETRVIRLSTVLP